MPLAMTMFPVHLASKGYVNHMLGKWHCGMSGWDRIPVHRGFNSSFGYLSGASRAVQFHPHGGQSDFVWLSARTPHGAYVW